MIVRVPVSSPAAPAAFFIDLPTYRIIPGSFKPVTNVPAAAATALGIDSTVVTFYGANCPLVHADGIHSWTPRNHTSVINATCLVEVPDEYFMLLPNGSRNPNVFDLEHLKEMYPQLASKFVPAMQGMLRGQT